MKEEEKEEGDKKRLRYKEKWQRQQCHQCHKQQVIVFLEVLAMLSPCETEICLLLYYGKNEGRRREKEGRREKKN
jgi:hypothetical protein